MYHSGVFFATLVVQLAMANGLPVSRLAPRKDCSGCEEDNNVGETGDNDFVINSRHFYRRKDGKGECEGGEGCSTSPAATSPLGDSTTTSQTNVSTTSQSTTSMTATSSTTSASVTPTAPPLIAATSHSTITTGGIVGAAFGSVVIAGLAMIVCGTYLHRWRKARKRGKGFVPATYLGPPPNFSQTEMSQTQSSPIISSAVASRMTSTPPHPYPHSITTSLSPLVPAANLEHSRSFTSSSNRRTSLSYTDGSSSHEPIHSIHEMSTSSWGASLTRSLNATHATLGHSTAGSITGSSVVSEPSVLLRALTGHQKALEAEDQKQSQEAPPNSKEDEAGIPEVHDPPPRYNA